MSPLLPTLPPRKPDASAHFVAKLGLESATLPEPKTRAKRETRSLAEAAGLRSNKDGSPWWARKFRITTIRIVSQVFFFALFGFLLWVTWLSKLKGYPASLFLEMDPLVGFATALSTKTVYRWLWRGVFILVPTLVLGRVFCNWICPYGTLHQFVGWLFNIRNNKS